MTLPPDVQAAIDEIRAVIHAGRTFMVKVFIDEQAFFIATSKLKKSLPEAWGQMATARRPTGCSVASLDAIDNLEMLIESGKLHIFGGVLVDKQTCLLQIEGVETALAKDIAEAQTLSVSHPSPATTDVQSARTEAERIIAEAKREAARIVEEAKRQRENPWSS
jgi:hypothetical protein